MFGLASLFGYSDKKEQNTLRDEISTRTKSTCRPTNCTNTSTGTIKIERVGPGCKFKSTQTCTADSTCIIKTAVDTVAEQLLKKKVSGGVDMSKSIVDVKKSDTKNEVIKKIENALDSECGASAATNTSARNIEIGQCEGEFDVSQIGDAKSRCVLDTLAKTKTRGGLENTEDNATATIILLVVLAIVGLGGLFIFIKMKQPPSPSMGAMYF